MILREGVVLAACGNAVGMALAYAVGRTMESLLAGVRPTDGVTFTAAAALAVAMTMSGSVIPALRAMRVDPATAQRTE
jgi:putative ABC transport system permease protein